MPPAGFFFSLSLSLSLLRLYYFFVLIVLAVPFALTVHHTTQTSMPPAGFKPSIPAGERLQTHAFGPLGHWDRLPVYLLAPNLKLLYSPSGL
jgi:hypothetical protein